MRQGSISYFRLSSLILGYAFFLADVSARPIDIRQVSDLFFGTAPQGDGPKIVPPGTGEDGQNASF